MKTVELRRIEPGDDEILRVFEVWLTRENPGTPELIGRVREEVHECICGEPSCADSGLHWAVEGGKYAALFFYVDPMSAAKALAESVS